MENEINTLLDNIIRDAVNLKQKISDISIQFNQELTPIQEQQKPNFPQNSTSELDDFEELKELLYSDNWPEAVNPHLICDPESEQDKKERGRGLLELTIDEDLKGLKFLDFGCGQGYCAAIAPEYETKISVGYDIDSNNKWEELKKEGVIFTDNFNKVKENGPYDVIMMFDVIDHLVKDSAEDVLKQAKEVLSENGKIYMRCHPVTSRHSTHLYHDLNKAYVHLVFTEDELNKLVPNSKYEEKDTLNATYPIMTYNENIEKTGLKIVNRREIKENVENFFKTPQIAKRIMKNTGHDSFPEFQMSLQFVDILIEK